MYSVCENLGQTQEIDIGKDPGKQIFYYLSHKTADIIKKFQKIKRYSSDNGKWGTTKLNIISIVPTIRNSKQVFKITAEKRVFYVDKNLFEQHDFMTNIF